MYQFIEGLNSSSKLSSNLISMFPLLLVTLRLAYLLRAGVKQEVNSRGGENPALIRHLWIGVVCGEHEVEHEFQNMYKKVLLYFILLLLYTPKYFNTSHLRIK